MKDFDITYKQDKQGNDVFSCYYIPYMNFFEWLGMDDNIVVTFYKNGGHSVKNATMISSDQLEELMEYLQETYQVQAFTE